MNIAILDDYLDTVRGLECFAKLAGHAVTVSDERRPEAATLAARLQGVDALVLNRERTAITDALLERIPSVRLISQTGAAIPHIDVDACTRRGVLVCAGGRAPQLTVELTWALILAAIRRIPLEAARLRAGGWQSTLGVTVRGRTLGIFGYGTIGSQVARLGPAFGANVLVWGREGSLERARRDGFEAATSKAALFERSDVLSLHLVLNDATRGIVTGDDLRRMKSESLIVNTSRAGLIEPGALVEALREGRPGFAAVDVYEDEPVLNGQHPLLGMDNALCTPHIGHVERSAYEHFFGVAFDQVLAFAAGNPINVVNPEVLARG